MINIKTSVLINSTEVLQKLAKTELKAKIAWQVARVLRAVEEEFQTFNDTRLALINKYGEKDANGELIADENNNCKIPPAHLAAFNKELNDLLNEEISINANKIKIENLENLDFTPADMGILEYYIDFDETEE